jgi:signal peptidase I
MENDSIKSKGHKKEHGFFFYVFVALLFCVLMRMLFVNSYTIVTPSMVPTIQPGDKVNAIKLLLFTRKIRPNDIIFFNKPVETDKVEVYCKRVLGCPGDRIGAVDGHYWNDKYLKPIGVSEEQERLRWMFDGFFKATNSFEVIPFSDPDWNIKNWGPIVVPAKGWTATLNDLTRELYRQVIEKETGEVLEDSLREYTFQKDYYFAVGDNAMSSFDSRYWGFIPEDYIIGIVGGKRFRNK